MAQRHAYGLLKMRPFRFTTFETVRTSLQQLGHPVAYNVEVQACSLRKLEEAVDLRAFGEWAAESTKLDFLVAPVGSREGT